MILQLDDNYRIVSDEHNFILQRKADPNKNPRKGRKAKETQWKNLGYWKDLSQLLASYTREVLRGQTGKTSLQHYLVTCEASGKPLRGLEGGVWNCGGGADRD